MAKFRGASPQPAIVFATRHVQHPVQAVFNAPVRTDRLTENFLPGLNVRAEVIEPHGPVASPADDHGTDAPAAVGNVPLMWPPWLYHYRQNWRVPSAGLYRLRGHVDPPIAIRYGKNSGKRMAGPVDVTFEDAHIKTGQK